MMLVSISSNDIVQTVPCQASVVLISTAIPSSGIDFKSSVVQEVVDRKGWRILESSS